MHAFAITGPAPPGEPSPAPDGPPTGVRTRRPPAPTWHGPTPGALIISEGTD